MKKNIKVVCREIKQGKQLGSNVPIYFNRLVDVYEQYASINFIMNYFMLLETEQEATFVKTEEEKAVLDKGNAIIEEYFIKEFSQAKVEDGIKAIGNLRTQIMDKMTLLTSYTDVFLLYEYVLERIKYKFEDITTNMEEEEFLEMVMNYIFEYKDAVVVNDKIKEILGELPVRMTRNKYFELVKDSLSIYKGGERSSLKSYLYMLETGAGIYQSEGIEDTYENLKEMKEEFETLNFSEFTKEQYDLYREKLDAITLFIQDRVNFYYELIEIVNNLYVMLLAKPYTNMEGGYRIEGIEEMKYLLLPSNQLDIVKEVVVEIHQFFNGEGETSLEDIEDKLPAFEGVVEKLIEEVLQLEATLDEIKTVHKEEVERLELTPMLKALSSCQNLLGESMFIELDKEEKHETLSEEDIRQAQEEIIEKLSSIFSKGSKILTRAIIAGTINKMPVFFQTAEEIREYIKNSIEQCRDTAEKYASMDIISKLCGN